MAYARKMQQFSLSLNVPERIRKGYVWSVTYSIKCVIDNLSYCKTNEHWVESKSLGARQLQGGGLCLKALPSSIYLLACLCCLSSLTILQFHNFFYFHFVLILFFFIVLTFLGTWHFIIVQWYVYIAGVDMTWVPSLCWGVLTNRVFLLRLDVIFLRECSCWVNKANCMNVR